VLLVLIACFADATFQLYAAALLYDMRCLMGGGMQVRHRRKRNMVPGGERLRPHRARASGGRGIRVRLDVPDVMATEHALDRVAKGQGTRATRNSLSGCGMHSRRRRNRVDSTRCLWHLLHQGLHPGLFARHLKSGAVPSMTNVVAAAS
jgi:hypothetical protein